jgi:hypothetical protein
LFILSAGGKWWRNSIWHFKALLHSRAEDVSGRTLRLWAMGEKERATKLLREGDVAAREMPTSESPGYVRGVVARNLALVELARSVLRGRGGL